MSHVVFKDVNKSFPALDGSGEFQAVRNLNLSIEQGELVTLLGPSGCGKTTTLRMLAGFESPTSGSIFIADQDVTNRPVSARGVGMMFQGYALFPHMTVFQNVEYGLRAQKVSKAEIRERVGEVMDLMDITEFRDRTPAQLSGGQQQRVALARSVVTEPGVLLFDEPLSNLDAQLRERMRDELRAIQQRLGITSLYVTHDQSEALAISDQVVVMNEGLMEQKASPRIMYDEPDTRFVAGFLGKANIWDGYVVRGDGDAYLVRCGYHEFIARSSREDLHSGQQIGVTMRPHSLGVERDPKGKASVERAVFQGDVVEYLIVDEERRVNVVSPVLADTVIIPPGENVRLILPEKPAWIIPDDTEVEK